MASPSSCPIMSIPLEVLLRVTDFLTTPELCNLRLTCRHVEESLYRTFGAEFFSRKQFMMSPFSLQALIDISKSRLSPFLRRVQFGLERINQSSHLIFQDEKSVKKFKQMYAEHFTMWNTGHHRIMLAEAFRNLKNLEDVVIRDFNSKGRTRDGENVEWTSYGATLMCQETGTASQPGNLSVWVSGFPLQWSGQVMTAFLAALSDADARPKGFEVMSRNNNHLRDFAFFIPYYSNPKWLPMLEELEKLHLCVDLNWKYSQSDWIKPDASQSSGHYMLRTFLTHTKKLKHLRINERFSADPAIYSLIDWLAMPAGDTIDHVPSIDFHHLEELNLGMMAISSSLLLELMCKLAPTLKRLELWKIIIVAKNRHLNDGDTQERHNLWAKFLRRLAEVPDLDLRHVKFGMAQQQMALGCPKLNVSFAPGEPVREYTGTDWRHFVREIASKATVDWGATRNGEEEEEEEEDDDDDFDDEDEEDYDDDDTEDGVLEQYGMDIS